MNVYETIEIMSLVSRGQKYFKLAVASRRDSLSGNTSLIATFSIVYYTLQERRLRSTRCNRGRKGYKIVCHVYRKVRDQGHQVNVHYLFVSAYNARMEDAESL